MEEEIKWIDNQTEQESLSLIPNIEESFTEQNHFLHFDMLHDQKRNYNYWKALEKEITPSSYCLDIGTGSGLLAMMCVKAGAHQVTAIEVSPLRAEIAKECILVNKMEKEIQVINKHSTEITVNSTNGDMKRKADLFVGELLDTGLIGEGVLSTMRHATSELLTENCIIIPHSATIFAVLVDQIDLWKRFQFISSDILCEPPNLFASCRGIWEQLHVQPFLDSKSTFLSPIFECFQFDFRNPPPSSGRQQKLQIQISRSGIIHCLIFWWIANLDRDGEFSLDTKPGSPPPDHWRQGVVYLTKPFQVDEGDKVFISVAHDDDDIWFFIHNPEEKKDLPLSDSVPRCLCTCSLHSILQGRKMKMLNYRKYNEQLKKSVFELLNNFKSTSKEKILIVGDNPLIPIYLSQALFQCHISESQIVSLVSSENSEKLQTEFLKSNFIAQDIFITSTSSVKELLSHFKLTDEIVVISEPYFEDLEEEWDLLHFLCFQQYIRTLKENGIQMMEVFPKRFVIKGALFESPELWKVYQKVDTVQGISVGPFNKLFVEESIYSCFTFPYTFQWLSKPFTFFQIELNDFDKKEIKETLTIPCVKEGICSGVLLWIEYEEKGNSFQDLHTETIHGVSFTPKPFSIILDKMSEEKSHPQVLIEFTYRTKSESNQEEKEESEGEEQAFDFSINFL